jgi:nucleoside phosphorylase
MEVKRLNSMRTNISRIPIPHLCVVTAATIEFQAVARQLEARTYAQVDGLKRCQGRAGRNFVTVLQAEIGAPGFAEKLTEHLHETDYDALFILGLAGALVPELKTGELIFYDTCFAFRPEVGAEAEAETNSEAASVCDFQVSSTLRQVLLTAGLECMFGAGLTLDFMATTPEEKLAMGESYQAAAVDMESYDVIQAGTQCRLPVVTLRVILDEAEQKTPNFNLALAQNGRMNILKTILALALRPLAAIQFFFSLARAMKGLQRAAQLVLQAEPNLRTSTLLLAKK